MDLALVETTLLRSHPQLTTWFWVSYDQVQPWNAQIPTILPYVSAWLRCTRTAWSGRGTTYSTNRMMLSYISGRHDMSNAWSLLPFLKGRRVSRCPTVDQRLRKPALLFKSLTAVLPAPAWCWRPTRVFRSSAGTGGTEEMVSVSCRCQPT
jgi:hypothetical protein